MGIWDTAVGATTGAGGVGARLRVCEWGTKMESSEEEGEAEGRTGPRLNRAWPVRFKREMSFLNLATVWSVRSEQSMWFGRLDMKRIRCSMLLKPCDVASCIAVWSSIFGKPRRSTAISRLSKVLFLFFLCFALFFCFWDECVFF